MIKHQDLLFILFQWRDFANGDASRVRSWTDKQICSDESLVAFTHAMTRHSWQKSNSMDIIDLEAFRGRLKRIQEEGILDEASLESVRVFLDTWDKQQGSAVN